MSSIAVQRGAVTVGVDTHKDQHVAFIIDSTGAKLSESLEATIGTELSHETISNIVDAIRGSPASIRAKISLRAPEAFNESAISSCWRRRSSRGSILVIVTVFSSRYGPTS
jgi:hypothetical protein